MDTQKDDEILQKEVLNISEEQLRICHLLTKQIRKEIQSEIDSKTDQIAEIQENHQKEIEGRINEFFKASVYHFMERLRKSKSTLPTETTTETKNHSPSRGGAGGGVIYYRNKTKSE